MEENLYYSYIVGSRINNSHSSYVRNSLAGSYKTKHQLPYDLTIIRWGIYLREMKIFVNKKKKSTRMLIAT